MNADIPPRRRWPILPGDIPEPTGEVAGEDPRMRLLIFEWWKAHGSARLPITVTTPKE